MVTATGQRHQKIIDRGLDELGMAGDFNIHGNGDHGPEIRGAAKKRYQELLIQSKVIGHNGRETLLLCAVQSMVQNFVIGYKACLVARRLPLLKQ